MSVGEAEAKSGSTVLLTGATGFLGSQILLALVEHTKLRVVCLVRAKSDEEALRRVQHLPGMDWKQHGNGIGVIRGDLSSAFALSEPVDLIIHNGALVNSLMPYVTHKGTLCFAAISYMFLRSSERSRYPELPVVIAQQAPFVAPDSNRLHFHIGCSACIRWREFRLGELVATASRPARWVLSEQVGRRAAPAMCCEGVRCAVEHIATFDDCRYVQS